MKTVRQVLNDKGYGCISVKSGSTVYEAIKVMAEQEIGAVVVMEDGLLLGVLSERDYARKIILQGRRSRDSLVKDIMVADVVTVRPDDSIDTCMNLMTQHRIRHLPVVQQNEVVGMVSIGDVVKTIMQHQEFVIEQLEQYIGGVA